MIFTFLLFLLLAASGAVLRWLLSQQGLKGTVFANVLGAFLLALTSDCIDPGATTPGLGPLGPLTTFSTSAAAATQPHEQNGKSKALLYLAATLALGVSAAYLGLTLSQ